MNYLIENQEYELYDLSKDVSEQTDFVTHYPDKFEELRSTMEKARVPNEFFEW